MKVKNVKLQWKRQKKTDKKSSPLADIDRDTEQGVQDNAILVFDKETERSCEQNNNHKIVFWCAKTLTVDQGLAFKGYNCK